MSSGVREGDLLASKYRVEKVLGEGGMGIVVAATHVQLGHRVALKFLLADASSKADFVARFLREARAAVSIQSEHVARVLDVGQLDTGAPYMVMELLDGHDLAAELRQRGPLPIERAVDFLLQAGEAVAEAHARGLVHRDLKPANLFLTRRADGSPLVKVLDFGIAKMTDPTLPEALTKTTAVMGSPIYMSPEQVRSSKTVDARSDIWSLGIVLQELIGGRPSFDAETASALMAMIAADPPAPLRAMRPDAPEALERAILRCLAKRLEERTPSMAALAMDLAPFASAKGRISVERIVDTMRSTSDTALRSSPPEPPARDATRTDTAWGKTSVGSKSRGRALFALGASVAVALVVGGYFLGRQKPTVAAPVATDAAPSARSPLAAASSPTEPPPPPSAAASASQSGVIAGAPPPQPPKASGKRPTAPAPADDPLKTATGSRK